MLAVSTLNSCGSSSRDTRRSNAPTRVHARVVACLEQDAVGVRPTGAGVKRLRVDDHAAELPQLEQTPAAADPSLAEEHRAPRIELYRQGDNQQQGDQSE